MKPFVVSLTSIPPRFDKLGPVLDALLNQTAKIDEIQLHIPKRYRRFPDYDGGLPDVPPGIRIVQSEDDLGPASKVLFAADALSGTDCNLLYCDDDRLYSRDWFSKMLEIQSSLKEEVCVATSILSLERLGFPSQAARLPRVKYTKFNFSRTAALTRRKLKQVLTGVADRKPPRSRKLSMPGYADIAEGCGAVLVKPEFFDAKFYDIPPALWSVDDVWLSGHMERKGFPIWCGAGFGLAPHAEGGRQDALFDAVIDGVGRDDANAACIKYMQDTYGIWL